LQVEPSDLPQPFGPFTLLRLLAQGGMGAVYLALRPIGDEEARARDMLAGREEVCVVKTVRADLKSDKEAVGRFLDEARVVQRLSHPKIARTLDAGIIDKTYFLCLEFISGRNLRDITLRAQKLGEALPEPLIFHVVSEMLDALDYAHRLRDAETGRSLRVVHRDVSPHNVMLSFDGNAKLIDFGLAAHDLKRQLTQPGIMVGKLRYNAPEQVRDRALDGRSDVYSAGVVLYEFVANERFYEGLTEDMIWRVAMTGDHRPRSWNDIDGDLRRLIDMALQHDPEQRYRTAGDFRRALLEVAVARGVDLKTLRRASSRFLQQIFSAELAEEREMILQATGIAEARTRLFRSPSDVRSAIGQLGSDRAAGPVDLKTEIIGHDPDQLRELRDMMSRLADPQAITIPPTRAVVSADPPTAETARRVDRGGDDDSGFSLVTAASMAAHNRLDGMLAGGRTVDDAGHDTANDLDSRDVVSADAGEGGRMHHGRSGPRAAMDHDFAGPTAVGRRGRTSPSIASALPSPRAHDAASADSFAGEQHRAPLVSRRAHEDRHPGMAPDAHGRDHGASPASRKGREQTAVEPRTAPPTRRTTAVGVVVALLVTAAIAAGVWAVFFSPAAGSDTFTLEKGTAPVIDAGSATASTLDAGSVDSSDAGVQAALSAVIDAVADAGISDGVDAIADAGVDPWVDAGNKGAIAALTDAGSTEARGSNPSEGVVDGTGGIAAGYKTVGTKPSATAEAPSGAPKEKASVRTPTVTPKEPGRTRPATTKTPRPPGSSLKEQVDFLRRECAKKVACARSIIEAAGQLKTLTLDEIKQLRDEAPRCVERCLR
jgi:serine/threonine protein kinase